MAAAPLPTVLVLSDTAAMRARVSAALGEGYDCLEAADFAAARAALSEHYVQVLVSEPLCAAQAAQRFRAEVRERWPETVRIVLAADGDDAPVEPDVFQLLGHAAEPPAIRHAVQSAARFFSMAREKDRLALELRCAAEAGAGKQQMRRAALVAGPGFEAVLRAPASPMVPIVEAARQFASFDLPVLLTGESGTGKALLARAIHYGSLRSDRAFHSFDCSGVSDAYVALELLGARNGSVPTGQRSKIGLLQKADRGTLYLSGIHALSPDMQATLLRILNERAFLPVGGHEPVATSVRLIAGTDADICAAVTEGRFRADLFYALSVAPLHLPPLRQRAVDIPLLARKFLFDAAAAHAKPVHGLSEAALGFLTAYDWPGNMRELKNEITRMLVFAQDRVLGPELISRHILQAAPAGPEEEDDRADEALMTAEGSLKERIEAIEARILRETLTRLKWNKSRAAGELGLSRVGLRAKLERYGVAQPEPEHAEED